MNISKTTKAVSEFLKNYFDLLGLEVNLDLMEEDEVIKVDIKTGGTSSGLLIGSRGKNVYSLQRILNSVFAQDAKKKLVVDVDGWRSKEESRLKDLALKTAEHVKQTKQPQNLYNLSPSQRRVIHTFLSQVDGVKTQSEGEGNQRYLVVMPS